MPAPKEPGCTAPVASPRSEREVPGPAFPPAVKGAEIEVLVLEVGRARWIWRFPLMCPASPLASRSLAGPRGRCSFTRPKRFRSEPRVAGCDPTSHIHNPAGQAGPPVLAEYEVGGGGKWGGGVFLFRGCFSAEREPSVPQLPGACGHSEKMKTSAPL